jgi:hypothetical protein
MIRFSFGETKMSEEQKVENTSAKDAAIKAAAAVNASRTGVGTRLFTGSTRGKNPIVIQYEKFDETQPDTLPKSVSQFMELVSTEDKVLLDFLLRGYNEASYEAASDPLAEYVVDSWAPDVKLTFRTAVRNYAKGLGIEFEDAVNIIRPGFIKKFGE